MSPSYYKSSLYLVMAVSLIQHSLARHAPHRQTRDAASNNTSNTDSNNMGNHIYDINKNQHAGSINSSSDTSYGIILTAFNNSNNKNIIFSNNKRVSRSSDNSGINIDDNSIGSDHSDTAAWSRSLLYRTGGYPKFPSSSHASSSPPSDMTNLLSTSDECGQRSVFHDMERQNLRPTGRIIGGSPAPYGAYPWTANLELKYGASLTHHHCGGAIISQRYVLTAAHCVSGFRPKELVVKVGDNSRSEVEENEQTFEVEDWRVHPEFKAGGDKRNDLAVLKLRSHQTATETGITVGATVSAACLPTHHTPYTHGTWCYVTGWGITNIKDQDHKPDRLQAASIPLLDDSVCVGEKVHGGSRGHFGAGMVCAGYLHGTVDACGGDSGGPLVCDVDGRFTVLGIVSWGTGCAKPNKPGVYTKVEYYLDWIKLAMDDL